MQAPGVRLLLADLLILEVARFCPTSVFADLRRRRRPSSRRWWCRRGRRIPTPPRWAGGRSGRSWRSATGSICSPRAGSCRWPGSRPCPCRSSSRRRAASGALTASVSALSAGSSFFASRDLLLLVGIHEELELIPGHFDLPIQKGLIFTLCCGPSSGLRPLRCPGCPW